jgi:hypothetical protein
MLARYTLAMPFLQAFTGVALPVSVACALWVRVPVGLALLTFLPAVPTVATLAFEVAGLREFGRIYYVRPKPIDYARLLVGTFFYQIILAGAALRAVAREALGHRGWEKTTHVGAHRTAATTVVDVRDEPRLRPEDALPAGASTKVKLPA